MHIDREELAWAAGLFEGEGCITGQVCNKKFYYPKAFLIMTDFDVVVRFQEALGFGSFVLRLARREGWKDQLEVNVCSFEKFQQLVCLLWPWLGIRRRARIVEVLRLARESRQ